MTRRRYPVGALCGHVGCPDARCWWQRIAPHGPTNPDPAGRCRYCAVGTMRPRGVHDGGVWATCDQCGTSRFIRQEAS